MTFLKIWLGIMSGHGPNPIFFNKKLKIGRPVGPITSHFFLIPPPPTPSSKWTSYVYRHMLYILQSSHSSKDMMKLLLQVVFWNILNVLLVWLLLKCSVFITCLQQSILEFEKHGERLYILYIYIYIYIHIYTYTHTYIYIIYIYTDIHLWIWFKKNMILQWFFIKWQAASPYS